MTEEEEKKEWARIINELQDVMSVAKIAEAVGVDDREVWRWKAAERRPRGIIAVRVYSLHVKRCPDRQWLSVHVHASGNIAM